MGEGLRVGMNVGMGVIKGETVGGHVGMRRCGCRCVRVRKRVRGVV